MNEKIKEFAEQCWDERLDGRHFDQEKFAELIIRETVWKVYNHQTLYHQPGYKFENLVKDIREEFGWQ